MTTITKTLDRFRPRTLIACGATILGAPFLVLLYLLGEKHGFARVAEALIAIAAAAAITGAGVCLTEAGIARRYNAKRAARENATD